MNLFNNHKNPMSLMCKMITGEKHGILSLWEVNEWPFVHAYNKLNQQSVHMIEQDVMLKTLHKYWQVNSVILQLIK